ncbi:MAG TPA: methyltransferase [Streptosporangiaceae bacterium]|nr:methyltransferase [Streptosporangiaceae bacterium]
MSEDRRAENRLQRVERRAGARRDALGAPCWEPQQQERRWAATATALETLRSCLGNRQPRRIVDLGCGSGELTTRIASLWPAADIVAVDQSDLMTLFTQVLRWQQGTATSGRSPRTRPAIWGSSPAPPIWSWPAASPTTCSTR